MKRLASKPSPSLVLSIIAVLIALGGQAGALPGKHSVGKGDLAKGAVTAFSLAPGAVKAKALARHAVTNHAIATNAVTDRTIAPFSVGGLDLGSVTGDVAIIPDTDPIADDGHWTSSPTVSAGCPGDGVLLAGGVVIRDSIFHSAFVQTSGPRNLRWEGVISTDTGGASPGMVYAMCLL
jgi:hypothetical protein